jgi:hypothetical protein
MSIRERNEVLEWYAMMMGVLAAMPQDEKEALYLWERTHLDGHIATSDWPGWEKYIGTIPSGSLRPRTKKAFISKELRWAVWLRDDFTCRECKTRSNLSVDHVIPESKGGTLEIDNLQTLCRPCNSRKGTSL